MSFKTIAPATLIAAALMFGTIGPSDAKGKKEAAPQQTALCMTAPAAAVCATRGTMKFTYANACYAMQDGAKVSRAGACKAGKVAKKSSGKKKAMKKASKKKS